MRPSVTNDSTHASSPWSARRHGQSARTRPARIFALDCDLDYQDWVSIVNRITSDFALRLVQA
jgi:hypothetical protein